MFKYLFNIPNTYSRIFLATIMGTHVYKLDEKLKELTNMYKFL